MIPLNYEGWFRANINFQIMFCHSPIMLFSFLGNLFMQFRILLFPFEFCYSFFRFYYAIMNSLIQFPILLFAFELCHAVFQCCYSIVQSSPVVSNNIISFQILLVTILILLCHYEFFYSPLFSFNRGLFCMSMRDRWTSDVHGGSPQGLPSSKWRVSKLS